MRGTLHLGFTGVRTVSAPLTWAQDALWRAVAASPPDDPSFGLSDVWAVPPWATSDKIAKVLRRLLERHESLRTRFLGDGPGPPRQRVCATGAVEAELVEMAEVSVPYAWRLAEQLRTQPYDLVREWPVRLRLLLDGTGAVVFVLVAVHQLAADRWSLRVLHDEFDLLLARGPGALPAPAPQPVERVRFERSPEGCEIQSRTQEFWCRELARAPAVMLWPPPGPVEVEHARWDSSRLAAVVSLLATRHEVSVSAVMLAAVALALACACRAGAAFLRVVAATRSGPGAHGLVGAFSQEAPLLLAYDPDTTVARFLRAAHAGALRAYLHAETDCAGLGARTGEVLAARGIPAEGYCFFSDVRFFGDIGDGAGPARVRGEAAGRLSPLPPGGAMFCVVLERLDHTASVTLSKARSFLPHVGAAEVLGAVETLLVRAAADPGAPLRGVVEGLLVPRRPSIVADPRGRGVG